MMRELQKDAAFTSRKSEHSHLKLFFHTLECFQKKINFSSEKFSKHSQKCYFVGDCCKMSTTCEIDFENNPSKVVYSGQKFRGSVNLTLAHAKIVRTIFIKLSGKASVWWAEGSSKNRKTFSGSEQYLNERINLIEGNSGKHAVFKFF